ncbi:photosynthetic reaction center subunit L [Candidatus Roseilinea sp. NK_OTU-006]|jgi:photosynthetic reaction center L subunit|nr:photosynthetic reaction center subunit L [Candidatus Roseilinea sp. NK_OTU-006]
MLSFEAKYRQEAMAVPPRASFGLLKIWIGRFYLGFWGVVALVFGILGSGVWFWQVLFVDPNRTNNPLLNFIRGQIAPPPPSVGLAITFDPNKGFWWLFVVFCATVTFFAWMMRQIDISRLLKIGYQVPIAFGAVLSSWVTIQIVRPILLGSWSEGFPLGVIAHLDWLSAFGYRYYNFFYNPFHAIGITLLFGSAFVLSLHGATILSAARKKSEGVTEENVNRFYWDFFGYSIGEIGIHRLAFWAAVMCVLMSNLCFVLSGTVVQDWSAFWDFWNYAPFWKNFPFN